MEFIQKISPSFDGTTSWFKYEERIEDWLEVTVLDTSKQGPALKNRLHGNAEKYRGLLDRDALKAEQVETPLLKELTVCSSGDFTCSCKERQPLEWSAGFQNLICGRSVQRILGWTCYLLSSMTEQHKASTMPGRHDSINCRKTMQK